MHIVLFEPEIPPNTGNVARLCAAMQVDLHLIEPLGFSIDDRYLKRAGLDYWPYVNVRVWPNLEAYLAGPGKDARLVASSSRNGTPVQHFHFTPWDALLLGPETRGLPEHVLERAPDRVRIPISGNVRSLNLSTAAGILLIQGMASTGLLDAVGQPEPPGRAKTALPCGAESETCAGKTADAPSQAMDSVRAALSLTADTSADAAPQRAGGNRIAEGTLP